MAAAKAVVERAEAMMARVGPLVEVRVAVGWVEV